jgi:hypothetical protein
MYLILYLFLITTYPLRLRMEIDDMLYLKLVMNAKIYSRILMYYIKHLPMNSILYYIISSLTEILQILMLGL